MWTEIANTDDSEKEGTHWWSILDIEPKTDICFFDSYGLDGLKHFIIQDDKEIIDKILIGIDKMDRTDDKITLCKIKFSLSACKELTEDEILSLSDTVRHFFYQLAVFFKFIFIINSSILMKAAKSMEKQN